MKRTSEYKQRAEECRKLARAAHSPEHKKMLLDMAATWDLLARERADRVARKEWLAQLERAAEELKRLRSKNSP